MVTSLIAWKKIKKMVLISIYQERGKDDLSKKD
jgi:hypothetical protein